MMTTTSAATSMRGHLITHLRFLADHDRPALVELLAEGVDPDVLSDATARNDG